MRVRAASLAIASESLLFVSVPSVSRIRTWPPSDALSSREP